MAAANELARFALQKIKEESSNLGLWLEMTEVTAGILAKTSEDCSDFFSITVYSVAQCVCQSAPVFLNKETKNILKEFHKLVTSH